MKKICKSTAILAGLLALLTPSILMGQEVILTLTDTPNSAMTSHLIGPFGDYNNDGKDEFFKVDLVISDDGTIRDVISIVSHDGSVLRTHTAYGPNVVKTLRSITDVDADGVLDFIYTTHFGIHVVSGATGSFITGYPIASFTTSLGFGPYDVIGDLDGDSINDLVIGLPSQSTNGLALNGSVVVLSGLTGGIILQIDGTASNQSIGRDVVAMGDINADSVPDFAFLKIRDLQNPNGQDRVIFVSGANGSVIQIHVVPNSSNANPGFFTPQIAGGHDIDGDGVLDLVFTRPSDTTGGPNAGLIRTISGATGNAISNIFGTPCQRLGFKLSMADFNGDDVVDFVVGNQSDITTVPNESTVISGITGQIMIASVANAISVEHVSNAGDVNGDGYQDHLLVHRDPNNGFARTLVILAGGPALGQTADSMVGVGSGIPQDVLKINGQSGGQVHCVGCDVGAPITISIDQPTSNTTPADFVIFGQVGVPLGNATHQVPGVVGDMTMIPAPMAIWAIPQVFTLVSSVGPVAGGQVFLSGPAPWSFTMPSGVGFPATFTLEGIILENPTTAVKTNAVIINVH